MKYKFNETMDTLKNFAKAIVAHIFLKIKDVRGWQFLTIKVAETLCMVAYHQRNIFSEKNIWITDRPFKKSHFMTV